MRIRIAVVCRGNSSDSTECTALISVCNREQNQLRGGTNKTKQFSSVTNVSNYGWVNRGNKLNVNK